MRWQGEIVNAVEQQEWLDAFGGPLQKTADAVLGGDGERSRKIGDFLHGTWLGHPLHPVLTDVPVGAWTAALGMDLMERATGNEAYGEGADLAIAIGLAGAVGAAVTGLADWRHTTGHARRAGVLHALLNVTATALYAGSLVQRKRGSRGSGQALSWAGFLTASASAWIGGHLVYSEKIGVDHAPQSPGPREFTPVMPVTELPENTLSRVEVEGLPVLLVRRGERVHALAETCSHLGGPLADGELTDEGTVICPWHQSEFSLETGEPVHGPSTYSQPCFETRVREGLVEIRYAGGAHS